MPIGNIAAFIILHVIGYVLLLLLLLLYWIHHSACHRVFVLIKYTRTQLCYIYIYIYIYKYIYIYVFVYSFIYINSKILPDTTMYLYIIIDLNV